MSTEIIRKIARAILASRISSNNARDPRQEVVTFAVSNHERNRTAAWTLSESEAQHVYECIVDDLHQGKLIGWVIQTTCRGETKVMMSEGCYVNEDRAKIAASRLTNRWRTCIAIPFYATLQPVHEADE